MMLDNKNEQKWPLTEKEVLKKEQTVKGHFFCFFGQADRVLRSSKKKAADRCPNIFSISNITPVCQQGFVHNCLNFCFARMEII